MKIVNDAKAEIEAVIVKYNLAGIVVLHTPGFADSLVVLDPTYSCAVTEKSGAIKLKAKLKEDFGGNKAAQEERMRDTVNMFSLLTKVGSAALIPVAKMFQFIQQQSAETEQ